MKILLQILLVACLNLVAIAAEETESHPSELEILYASYGLAGDRVVVTDLLRPLVAHGTFLLRGNWDLGQPDPKPLAVKDVVIVYRFRGMEASATFNQKQDILLPPSSKGLTIISARYGVPGCQVDATDALRALVKDDAIERAADWELGRVDPAFRKIKTVEITYIRDGKLQTATLRQDQDLVLPQKDT